MLLDGEANMHVVSRTLKGTNTLRENDRTQAGSEVYK